MKRVLVVVAHPDDEVLGCGGTIAKLVDGGTRVDAVLAARRNDPRGVQHWPALSKAFEQSCRILGASPVTLSPLLDEAGLETKLNELHDALLPHVEEADLVLTHWINDVNQVHRAVARAVEIATRPFRRRRDVSCFEVLSSSNQGFGGPDAAAFAPSEYRILEASHVRRKLDAYANYPSEHSRGRSPEDVERQLRTRGAEVGAEFAEAFVTTRRFS